MTLTQSDQWRGRMQAIALRSDQWVTLRAVLDVNTRSMTPGLHADSDALHQVVGELVGGCMDKQVWVEWLVRLCVVASVVLLTHERAKERKSE